MKKILSILFSLGCLLSCDTVVLAQIPMHGGSLTGANSVASNGVTAGYLYVKASGDYKQASFQVVSTRVSTAQNGKCLLEGSNDGSNWIALSTSDSIHISDGATNAGDRFIVLTSGGTAYPNNGVNNAFYRLKCTQIAGDTATVKGFANFEK